MSSHYIALIQRVFRAIGSFDFSKTLRGLREDIILILQMRKLRHKTSRSLPETTRQVGGNVALLMPPYWEQNSIPSIKNWIHKINMAHFSSFSPLTKLNLWNWKNTANSWGLWSQPTDLYGRFDFGPNFQRSQMDRQNTRANAGPMLAGHLVGYFHRKQTQAINFAVTMPVVTWRNRTLRESLHPIPWGPFQMNS